MSSPARALERLASLYGIQPSYEDDRRRPRRASPESLVAILRALGAPIEEPDQAAGALAACLRQQWEEWVEPVHVAWEGSGLRIPLRVPEGLARGTIEAFLEPEAASGTPPRRHRAAFADLPTVSAAAADGRRFVEKRLDLPGDLLPGYYRLSFEAGDRRAETWIVSAPERPGGRAGSRRAWGAFLPLYALRSRRSWGIGDFTDLLELARWVGGQGGAVLGTLPILAAFLGEPFEISPYAPSSRLFWNEIFLDVEAIPEFGACPAAGRRVRDARFARQLRAANTSPWVDYRRVMSRKRAILEDMSRTVASGGSRRAAAFRRFLRDRPEVVDYARFRAVGERLGTPWQSWPPGLREGSIRPQDFDAGAERYHAYAQWVADEQIEALRRRSEEMKVQLYFDLPLGVHPSSYDVYRHRETFVQGASAGAPPDSFFTHGQSWGFPPHHPRRLREQRYRYFIAALRHQLRQARILRVDHVMWLHRLYFVPEGMDPGGGAYVRYPVEELYAILCLEAHRFGSLVVGEDLGTVPAEVRARIKRHALSGMYVLPLELGGERGPKPKRIPRHSLAALNTHDMPTFAAFWKGLDIPDRRDLGLLDRAGAAAERRLRARQKEALLAYLRGRGWLRGRATLAAVLQACLRHLSVSEASLVLVSLEDLWLETRPQNVPGTGRERPNWRRKARYPLEALDRVAARGLQVLRQTRHERN